MSTWYEPEKDDISFSDDKKEMHFWLFSDYSGSVYASVKVEDVIAKLKPLIQNGEL